VSLKIIFGGIGIAALLALLSSVASAQGVVGSPHDLQPSTTNTSETCVFCHTPHGSSTSAAVPLWNKTLPAPATYTRYSSLNTSTLSGAEAPVGSVSLACLSCHDGSQAVDTVLNTPGRGMGASFPAGTQIDAAVFDAMEGTPVPMLGTDLRDDHPVSIQYGGVGSDADGTANPANLGNQDFNAPEKDTINTNPAWWVDSEGTANQTREKTDMILYTRTDGPAGATGEPMVECGSSSTFVANQSVSFLRIPNDSSQICTTCHIK
jgi:hypothetical protein